MPRNLTEPPYVEDTLLRQWILDIHNHVYGLGTDITGTLDDDNLDDVIPNRTDTESITGLWTFDTDPSLAGTINNTFTLDSDDTGGNVDLIFGTAVGNHLRHTGSTFEFDDVLSLTDNSITNVNDIRLKTITSDDGTTVKVILGIDAGDDFIVGSNALVVSGDLSSVGIGTINIGATQLHVYANDNDAHLIYLENDARTYGFKVSDTGTGNDSFFITDITAGLNRFVIADGGNVGVGLDNPISLTHIYEDTSNVGTSAGLTIEQDGVGDAIVQFFLTGGRRWVMGIDNSDSDKFKIAKNTDLNSGVVMTMDTDGFVGINTTTPAVQLDVTGTIRCSTEIRSDSHFAIGTTDGHYGPNTLTTITSITVEGGIITNIQGS